MLFSWNSYRNQYQQRRFSQSGQYPWVWPETHQWCSLYPTNLLIINEYNASPHKLILEPLFSYNEDPRSVFPWLLISSLIIELTWSSLLVLGLRAAAWWLLYSPNNKSYWSRRSSGCQLNGNPPNPSVSSSVGSSLRPAANHQSISRGILTPTLNYDFLQPICSRFRLAPTCWWSAFGYLIAFVINLTLIL